MTNALVIYHGGCYDGFGVAWAAWKHPDWKDAEFHAASYGSEPPDVHGKHVLIGDFSYPRDVLLRMRDEAASITVDDHHKTAKEALAHLPFARFNMDISGSVMVWKALHPDEPVPALLRYIEDRDLWRFKLPNSKEATAVLRSYPFDFEVWDGLSLRFDHYNLDEGTIVTEGKAILRYQDRVVELICEQAYEIEIYGHRVWTANSSTLYSEVANALIRDREFGTCWWRLADGRVVVSLRSTGDFDVSGVAKRFGGGGHKNSAGFQTLSL